MTAEARPGGSFGAAARLRAGSLYTTMMVLASALGFVKLFVFAQVLGVTDLGYYGLVAVVAQYGVYVSNWGILNSLNAELPVARGRGDSDVVERTGRALGAIGAISTVAGALYLTVVVLAGSADSGARLALALAAFATVATTAFEFSVLLLRVEQRLVGLSVTYLFRALLALALGTLAGLAWGFVGVVLVETGVLAGCALFAVRRWFPSLRPRRPQRAETWAMVRIGLPLSLSNIVGAVALTADRVFVAVAIPADLGQYTFATMVVVAWVAVTGMISQVVGPSLLHDYGAGSALPALRARLRRLGSSVAAVSAIVLPALVMLSRAAGNGVLDEYARGMKLMPVLFIGGALSALGIYGVLLIAARRFYLLAFAHTFGAVVLVLGGLLVVALGAESSFGFAWAFVAGQAVSLTLTVVLSEREVRRVGKARAGEVR